MEGAGLRRSLGQRSCQCNSVCSRVPGSDLWTHTPKHPPKEWWWDRRTPGTAESTESWRQFGVNHYAFSGPAFSSRSAGDRPLADRRAGDRTVADDSAGERPAADRRAGDRPVADDTAGERPVAERTLSDPRTRGFAVRQAISMVRGALPGPRP